MKRYSATKSVYHVALDVFRSSDNCSFQFLLPDPVNCPKPGNLADEAIIFTQLVFGKEAKVKLIPAFGYQVETNRSVIQLVRSGEADYTNTGMSLAEDRARLLPYTRPVQTNAITMIYQRHTAEQGLNMTNLLITPRGLWFVLLVTVLIKFLLKRLLTKHQRKRSNGTGKGSRFMPIVMNTGGLINQTWRSPAPMYRTTNLTLDTSNEEPVNNGNNNHENMQESDLYSLTYVRIKLVSWLFIGLMLSALSNYLCILFSVRKQYHFPIQTYEDLREKISNGQFRLLYNSITYRRAAISDQDALKISAVWRPLDVANLSLALQMISEQNPFEATPRFIILTNTGNLELEEFMRKTCDLKAKNLRPVKTDWAVVYYRPGFHLPYTTRMQEAVMDRERRAVAHRYLPERNPCTDEHSPGAEVGNNDNDGQKSSNPSPKTSNLSSNGVMDIFQLVGVFQFVALGFTLSTVAFFLENLSRIMSLFWNCGFSGWHRSGSV